MRTLPFFSFDAGYPKLHTKVCVFRRAPIFQLFDPGRYLPSTDVASLFCLQRKHCCHKPEDPNVLNDMHGECPGDPFRI
jgi:hypothetical protein